MEENTYTVIGKKKGTFEDENGKKIDFYQLALDCGNYLKVFKVKPFQCERLESLEIGTVLTVDDVVLSSGLAVLTF